MLIIIPENHKNLWFFYTLTNSVGKILTVNVVRFIELTAVEDFFNPDGGDTYITIIDQDEDRLKLLNRANGWVIEKGHKAMQYKLHEIFKRWHKQKHGNARSVMCVETGQKWASARDCAVEQSVSYSQLVNHINGLPGFRTVKGHTYRRLD